MILKYILNKMFNYHVNKRHDPRDCLFCYLTPTEREEFMANLNGKTPKKNIIGGEKWIVICW